MINRLALAKCLHAQRGFSLLDVLIAIVVLATGLLALAVLQGAITRNGADARSRAQIAAYTESVVDRMRFAGYNNVVPSTTIANGTAITPTTCSGTLTLVQQLGCDATTVQNAAGVSNLQTTVSGTQYYGTGSGSTFGSTATNGVQAGYKDVTVTTTWTDPTGNSRSMSFTTTIDNVTTSTTDNSLANKSFSTTFSGTPKVREANPGSTAGVIPIAVSSSQNAAATNPQPLVTNTGTTFSTITYNATADTLGGNKITQRIDTKVMQCTCKYIASGGVVTTDTNMSSLLTQPYGPTYWDGTKYVTPSKLSATSSTTGVDGSVTQDTDCDICCRDRNDVSGNAVLFDNWSNGDFSKYQYNSSNVLTAVSSGTFLQTCRMIRVDGVYAAATDIRNYFFGILDTESCATAGTSSSPIDPVSGTTCTSSTAETSAVPSSSASTSYQSFVKDYLFNSISTLKAGSGPYVTSTSPLNSDSAAGLYDTTYSLNGPTSITLATTSDTRFLHARGLYIDHLETVSNHNAQQALSNAVANCNGSDEASLINCGVYAVIPFTTVNMTELAYWSASAANLIHTPVNASVGGVGYNPTRGYVYASSSTANGTVYDIATVNQLNSGLTGLTSKSATTATDAALNLTDKKKFVLNGSGGSSSGTNVYFESVLTGLSWLSTSNLSVDPSISWSGSSTQLGTAVSSTQQTSFLNGGTVTYGGNAVTTQTCNNGGNNCTNTTTYYPSSVAYTSPATAPVGLTVTVQGFNSCKGKKLDSSGNKVSCGLSGTGGGTETITCSGTGGSVRFTTATQCYTETVNATGITINGTNAGVTSSNVSLLSGTNAGGQSEGRIITIPNTVGFHSTTNTVAGADVLSIPFTETITVPTGTCVCGKTGGCSNSSQVTSYTPGTCSN